MPREFSRSHRVAAQIQRELAAIIQREIKDPRLNWLTVNAVKVTPDLSLAKVYFSTISQEADSIPRSLDALTKAAPFLRHQLSGKVRMRNIPELRFVYDESIERGRRITTILKDLERQGSNNQQEPS